MVKYLKPFYVAIEGILFVFNEARQVLHNSIFFLGIFGMIVFKIFLLCWYCTYSQTQDDLKQAMIVYFCLHILLVVHIATHLIATHDISTIEDNKYKKMSESTFQKLSSF